MILCVVIPRSRSRQLMGFALGAAAFGVAVVYVLIYRATMNSQTDLMSALSPSRPRWWPQVLPLAAGALCLTAPVFHAWRRIEQAVVILATTVLGGLALLTSPSIGLVLFPAVGLAGFELATLQRS